MWDMIKDFFLFSGGVLQATTLLLVILIFMYVRKTKRKTRNLLALWMININRDGHSFKECLFICNVPHETLASFYLRFGLMLKYKSKM